MSDKRLAGLEAERDAALRALTERDAEIAALQARLLSVHTSLDDALVAVKELSRQLKRARA